MDDKWETHKYSWANQIMVKDGIMKQDICDKTALVIKLGIRRNSGNKKMF